MDKLLINNEYFTSLSVSEGGAAKSICKNTQIT